MSTKMTKMLLRRDNPITHLQFTALLPDLTLLTLASMVERTVSRDYKSIPHNQYVAHVTRSHGR